MVFLAQASFGAEPPPADGASRPAPAAPEAKPATAAKDPLEIIKGATKMEGLFTLYRKEDHLYAQIKPDQLNKPFLAPIVIARGLASAGTPLNFGDEWIILFRRAGNKVQVVRKNIHYEAPKGSPLEKAVHQNYVDSVLMALPIASTNIGGGSVLIDLADIFLADFAGLRLGNLDRQRSSWQKVQAFPKNIELQVELTFARNPAQMMSFSGDDGVVDPRGITVVMHYSIAALPPEGYKPRLADQRVGHFISATKDFASKDPDTLFVRRINRWRLEKSNPDAEVSPPKEQLVWWVEDTVPHEYRPYVEEGILEWNRAFEKIGFRNAIGVRWQNERDDFDPEDINYCTFRWITTPMTFAMSGLRAHPITGEMIDGDVIFDASWIRAWKEEYAFLVGTPPANADPLDQLPLDVGEIVSPIMASKHGYGLPFPLPQIGRDRPDLDPDGRSRPITVVPSSWSPLQVLLSRRLSPGKFNTCQYAVAKRHEYTLAAMAFAARAEGQADGQLPEEFIGQAVKEVVMHEVGHSLGLRHNFKASAMLPLEQVNNTEITRRQGMVASVMDYSPINLARKGQKQGDYATSTIGPYDYWAIEYAYKPIKGDEKEELAKIAARSPQPELLYATDEDLMASNDPLVNTYDLGSDPLEYGKDRIALATDLLKEVDQKIVRDGESWARLRWAFSVLLGQYGNGAYLAAGYIGGQSLSRDFKGPNGRDPVTPIPGAKQREALQFLCQEILGDKAFQFRPELLRRLTIDHWYHWGSDSFYLSDTDYPVYDRILSIQRIVLNQCFDASVLRRLQNQGLLVDPGSEPLDIATVFRNVRDAAWSELQPGRQGSISIVRRNLQREHLRRLCTIVLGSARSSVASSLGYVFLYGSSRGYPADARNLARQQLASLEETIGRKLADNDAGLDEATRAHLGECQIQIKKVLEAGYEAGDL